MRRHQLRNLILGLISLACLGFTGFVAYSLIAEPEQFRPPIGGPFALDDVDGKRITDTDLAGGYLLIYFGYTYCPDICPTELIEMTLALEAFERQAPERAAKLTPIFITVDPDRDTPAVLRDYMMHFHPRFIALSGAETAIAEAAGAFNATYRRVPETAQDDYLMDHSAYVYLMGPDGGYVTHFTAQQDSAAMARGLDRFVR